MQLFVRSSAGKMVVLEVEADSQVGFRARLSMRVV